MKLFNGNNIDWEAYEKGKEACIEQEDTGITTLNPYKKETDSWYSWNKGFNSI